MKLDGLFAARNFSTLPVVVVVCACKFDWLAWLIRAIQAAKLARRFSERAHVKRIECIGRSRHQHSEPASRPICHCRPPATQPVGH